MTFTTEAPRNGRVKFGVALEAHEVRDIADQDVVMRAVGDITPEDVEALIKKKIRQRKRATKVHAVLD